MTGEIIRYLCIDMGCLSPQAWFWILPHYLRFCVTAGDQIDGLETEYLIYNFGTSPEHEAEKRKSLSLLNSEQVLCLVHFVEWVHAEEKWEKYFSEDLEKALRFLKTLEVQT